MPLILPDGLPAIDDLRKEGTHLDLTSLSNSGEGGDDLRPLRIAILNLMPIKETTEMDFIRVLSQNTHTLQLEFMKLRSHTSSHCSPEHMERFYRFSDEMMHEQWDGFIITGAPLEQYAYEEVRYWPEVQRIFNWARANVRSTFYVCWAGFAGLYHFYGVDKHDTPAKVFGIFPHTPLLPELPLFRGFDDEFLVPHSRHITLYREEIEAAAKLPEHLADELTLISVSPTAGVHMAMAGGGREFFITGHSEYAPLTLDTEYRRDLGKNLPILPPENYYRDDDPAKGVLVRWRAHARHLFNNWINYYVAK